MTSERGKTRRRYGTQFKALVLAQCDEPGASVAQVAMAHGINDNVVHRWRQLARQGHGAPLVAPAAVDRPAPAGFVPLALPVPVSAEAKTEVHLEIRRAAVTVSLAWPERALADLASFVRELLK